MGTYSNHHYNKTLQPFANNLRKNMTKAEACLWKYALRAGEMRGYTFRRQRPILDYIADFMCKELRLVIEVDGLTHHYEDVQEKDRKKQHDLELAGYTVMRFDDREVLTNMAGVRSVIEQWIDDRGYPALEPRSLRRRG